MDRRTFLRNAVIGLAGTPFSLYAQRPEKLRRIGFLSAGSPDPKIRAALADALAALGWVEGKNYVFENRYANNQLERLPEFVDELVRLNVDVIMAAGTLAPLAAKHATTAIPIVMTSAGDPLGSGLVASLAHPGGNITGLSLNAPELAGKRLQLLKEVYRAASTVVVLWNSDNPYSALVFGQTQNAGKVLEMQVESLGVKSSADLDNVLASTISQQANALITVEDPLTFSRRRQIIDFAAKHRIPAMYGLREFAADGGLIAYGANVTDLMRRSAVYVDKILKGAKPADLPVEQPTTFELVINLKTAKVLGLTVPQSLLLRADEVIQ